MSDQLVRGPYGVLESNTISEWLPRGTSHGDYLGQLAPTPVYWNDPQLAKVTRLRLLSDPGFPYWDVSYCYGELKDGTPVRVTLPFSQLNKFGASLSKQIISYAKKDGVYAKGLGILENISRLV